MIEPIIIEKWATKSHLFKEGEKLVRLWFKKDFRAWYPRGSVLQIRSDEIDGATPFALHRTARYEHDKRIPGKSTVRFAIGSSISKSKASDLFLPLSLSPYCQNLSNEGKSCTSGKRSSIIDPPLAYSIYAKRELFIRAHEAEWNGSRSKLLDWTLAS